MSLRQIFETFSILFLADIDCHGQSLLKNCANKFYLMVAILMKNFPTFEIFRPTPTGRRLRGKIFFIQNENILQYVNIQVTCGGVQFPVPRSRVATSEENAAVTLYIVSRDYGATGAREERVVFFYNLLNIYYTFILNKYSTNIVVVTRL